MCRPSRCCRICQTRLERGGGGEQREGGRNVLHIVISRPPCVGVSAPGKGASLSSQRKQPEPSY